MCTYSYTLAHYFRTSVLSADKSSGHLSRTLFVKRSNRTVVKCSTNGNSVDTVHIAISCTRVIPSTIPSCPHEDGALAVPSLHAVSSMGYNRSISEGQPYNIYKLLMVFMGRGFTSGGQESGSVFSVSTCRIQASKRCVESLPLVLKDKRSCFSQGERFAAQLPLECALALRKYDA